MTKEEKRQESNEVHKILHGKVRISQFSDQGLTTL